MRLILGAFVDKLLGVDAVLRAALAAAVKTQTKR